jgi:hypothetical protein
MLKRSWQVGLICLTGLLIGCAAAPDEDVVKKAFTAIKANDWETYSQLTITAADFMQQQAGIGMAQEQLSYIGTTVKPQQQQKQRQQFERAVAGEPGTIDFARVKFLGLGEPIERGTHPLLTGGEMPYTVYVPRLAIDGKELDGHSLVPRIVLVQVGEAFRILELDYGD